MGEQADMMIDGTMCQQCGTYIGDAIGYPRYCDGCRPKKQGQVYKAKVKAPTKGEAAIKGVKSFLLGKGIKDEWDLVCCEYIRPILGVDTTREQRCERVQRDFGAFVKWFKEYQKRNETRKI